MKTIKKKKYEEPTIQPVYVGQKWDVALEKGNVTKQEAHTFKQLEQSLAAMIVFGCLDGPDVPVSMERDRMKAMGEALAEAEVRHEQEGAPSYLFEEEEVALFPMCGHAVLEEDAAPGDELTAVILTQKRMFLFISKEPTSGFMKSLLQKQTYMNAMHQVPLDYIRAIHLSQPTEQYPYGTLSISYQMPQYISNLLKSILNNASDMAASKLDESIWKKVEREERCCEFVLKTQQAREAVADLMPFTRPALPETVVITGLPEEQEKPS